MEKRVKTIAGIDVSKRTFDLAVGANSHGAIITKACFANNLHGYAMLEDWLEERGFVFEDILFCLENTGLYHRLLASYLLSKESLVWVEPPVEIKWSMGIQRGKSDPVDAERIYTYAFRNQDKINPYEEKDKSLQQIADYMALRERLQTCIKTLKLPVKELKSVGLTEAAIASEKASAKQLASYAGIAPFEYSSGTSIRGRTKVHPMANKTLKKVLHMCAVSSVRHNPEMVTYFNRKVDEGKNKMLVLNAVRNKVLHRVFSCVRDQRMYTQDYAA